MIRKGSFWSNTARAIPSLRLHTSHRSLRLHWLHHPPLANEMEWRREEEERLVYLAGLQALVDWRAVAAEVGRTPAQCMERYEELLDVACARDRRHDPRDDLRRLRAGEVGPDAEDGRTPPA